MSSYTQHASHRHPTDRCPGFITDLILRCAAGDKPALGSLFDLMYPLVNAIVGSVSPSDSDETLVVATFHRLWDQAPTYDSKLSGSVEWIVAQARAVRAETLRKDVPDEPATLTC